MAKLLRLKSVIVLFTLLPVAAGCSYIGPKGVHEDRRNYNEALQNTNDQELLLNLVRLRYNDTPSFIDVASITSSLSMTSSIGPSLTITKQGTALSDVTKSVTTGFPIPSISATQTPTIQYAPKTGDSYVREILTPLNGDLLALLAGMGWPLEYVFKLCVTEVNEILNAPQTQLYSYKEPTFEEFDKLVSDMAYLEHKVYLGFSAIQKKSVPTLRFRPGVLDTPQGKKVAAALGLPSGKNQFMISANDWVEDKNVLNVRTRSLMGILQLLSNSVNVPKVHKEKGWVNITRGADGKPFDWNRITKVILDVRVHKEEPSDADIVIQYRGHWFSIARNDLSSKRTLTMVVNLLMLESGASTAKAPALTIPLAN